jgi:hypothetical protein
VSHELANVRIKSVPLHHPAEALSGGRLQGSKPVADYRKGVFRGPELKKLSGGKVKILADPKDTIDVAELTRMSEERLSKLRTPS